MKSLRNKFRDGKTIIVISDLHLGAGESINGKRNLLEDFYFDQELIDFFQFFSGGIYLDRKVEIIINGDFLDFLATPYLNNFEDEFWREDVSVKKMDLIRDAHREVFIAMGHFLKVSDKFITYNVGNHDAEIILPAVQQRFKEYFPQDVQHKIKFPKNDTYSPAKGIFIQHGHQYEKAHAFDLSEAIVQDNFQKNYLKPTWGSYYCINVINKFKLERSYINQIQPIKNFLIHGLLFDTFFAIRFMFSNVSFFLMVRIYLWLFYFKKFKFRKIYEDMKEELLMFQNYEALTRKFFQQNEDAKILIVGHTHHPGFRHFKDGTTFINTGTWTKIISLDFSFNFNGYYLTFAQIDMEDEDYELTEFSSKVKSKLLVWRGDRTLPYDSYFH